MFSRSFSLAALVLARAQEVALPDAATPLPPANHLAGESSPYLLQHAHNPVDWHPWGPAALAKAVREDKPIFLSIGYAACHWCHVMERESFEDLEIAAFLNRHFVAIKVDREERPDLDELYMGAVQRLAGSGGWPMSVFLTPQRRPFYGGTYFPPRAAHGRPGFLELLQALEQAWRERRAEVEEVAAQVDTGLAVELPPAPPSPLPEPAAFRELEGRFVERLAATYDARHGGFGGAPKFPRADDLRWLLAAAERSGVPEARAMALHTLRRMAAGGMFDQLAGGFARYSVDERWLIPHFEKMLYDQGTLVPAYLEAWRQTGELRFAEVARATCDFLLRDLRDAGGAFWSSSDADSAGEEGRYFVWSPAELAAALGAEDAAFAAHAYDVTAAGNFEHGRSVLTRWQELDAAGEARLVGIRGRLLAARALRVAPAIDDKVLAGWNGLAIGALAQAGRLLDEPRFSAAAIEAAEFLLRELRRDGRWQRSWRDGRTGGRAVLEDHAFVARGFLELFQTTGEERWLREAEGLAARMLADYWDPAAAVFWNTDGDDETLLHRSATPWDGALPSANAVALECLGLLAAFTRDPRWEEPARLGYAALAPLLERSPAAFTATLRPMVRVLEEPWLAVVAGGTAPAQGVWRRALAAPGIPELLVVFRPAPAAASSLEIFAGRGGLDGLPTLYLCQGDRCLAPETDPVRLPALVGAEEDSGR